jgi:hypothetical protein
MQSEIEVRASGGAGLRYFLERRSMSGIAK